MSRPVTKGPAITLRLPLEVDAKIRDLAQRNEVSPGHYIADLVAAVKQPTEAEVTISNIDDPEVQAALENRSLKQGSLGVEPCRHRNAKVIGGGLKRCDDCGATRNAKGEWS